MKKVNLTFILIFTMLIMVFHGCVGTVQSNKEKKVKSPVETSDSVSYDGITGLEATSEQSLEVYFATMPASVSEAIFYIHLNNSNDPIKVVSSDLLVRSDGDHVFSIYNLTPATTYSVKVNLFDKGNKKLIKSKQTLVAKTFTQRVAEFKGIKSVSNYLGADSMTKLRLSYEPAINDSHINKKDYHNKRYAIHMTWGDSAERDILDLDNAVNKATVYQEHYTGTTANDSYDAVGLIPGTNYCFMMRAIHREYYYKDPSEFVPLETNTQYACGTTAATVKPMEWDPSTAKFSLGLGPNARDTIRVSWDSASGGFAGYLILIAGVEIGTAIPVGPGTVNQFTDTQMDTLIPGNITHVKQVENDFGAWDPNLRNFSISGLNNYSYYQVTMVACRNATCQDSDRIEAPMQLMRTIPNLPTNGGIDLIQDPWDKTPGETNKGRVEFGALDVNSGFADYLHLYCYSDETGSNPVLLQPGVEHLDPTHPCHGVIRLTPDPSSFADFDTFTQIEFRDTGGVDGNRYCFSLIPQIVDGLYTTDNTAYSAKIVCKTLRLLTPTLEQFPGLTSACTPSKIDEDKFTVNWNNPSGGLYTGYEAFVVNKRDQNFSFTNAIAGHTDYTKATIADGINAHQFEDLIPGETYQFGILAYLNDAGGTVYSEFNSGVVECQIPFPEAEFGVFQDIMAVGPKTDGSYAEHYLNSTAGGDGRKRKKALLETIDPITTLPAQVELDPDGITPLAAGAHSAANGSNLFDGIYGRKDNDGANAAHAYSNNGIVRIVWEDFKIPIATKADAANCESERADGYMNLREASCIYGDKPTEETNKNDRKFGYKVYRSYNNKSSWKELTRYDGTTNQTSNNEGLIRAEEYHIWGWNDSPGAARAMERKKIFAASFVDYSVVYEPEDISGGDPVERGLIAFYKFVPVFNGQELDFSDDLSKNVVRVIIPPANMAFVHRKMANKAMCDQMALPISTHPTLHYSCEYNGLGARPVVDYAMGAGRYDIGSDLLVDRYEIGCDFTRGSLSEAESTIHNNFAPNANDLRSWEFQGTSQSGNFIGCHAEQHSDTTYAWDSNGTTEYEYMLKGDCVGDGRITGVAATTCTDPTNNGGIRSYTAPGLNTVRACNDPTKGPSNPHTLDENVIEYFMQPAQPHAVYYYRDGGTGYSVPNIPGRNDTNLSWGTSSARMQCAINLPYVHDFGEGDRFVPRWISLIQIAGTNMGGSVWGTRTLREIYNDRTVWYDDVGDPVTHEVASPMDSAAQDIISPEDRYNYYLDRSIIRRMTSNEAHLPPISGFTQNLAQTVCEEYEVEIGSHNSGGAYVPLDGSKQTKGLPTRKLQLAMSQWPDTFRPTFDESNPANRGHLESIESGRQLNSVQYDGETIHPENMSCNVNEKNFSSANFDSGDLLTSNIATNGSNTTLATGSSLQRSVGGRSTEACISRFGVQDFVGNILEVSGDRVDCDTSGEEILFGPSAGAGRYNNSVLMVGNQNSDNEYYSTDPMHSGFSAWVQSNPNTGECSVYTDGYDRDVPFVVGGDINPVSLLDGSLNTDLIDVAYTPFDPENVQDFRDGFGTPFDTGQNGFSPPISANNTMSLMDTDNKYFNPAVGVRLNTNIESVFAYSEGNVAPVQMWWQVGVDKFFTNNVALNEDDFYIPYFPGVGLSEITSIGMSEVNSNTTNYDPTQDNPRNYDFYYDVTLGAPNSPTTNTAVQTDTFTWGAPISLSHTYWQLDRNIASAFYSGGSYNEVNPGRYTSVFRAANAGSATRCMVRIESD